MKMEKITRIRADDTDSKKNGVDKLDGLGCLDGFI